MAPHRSGRPGRGVQRSAGDSSRTRIGPARARGVVAAATIALLAAAGCSLATGRSGPTTASPSVPSHPPAATTEDAPGTITVSGQPTTIVTTPTVATPVAPPPTTVEPPAAPGMCPYLTNPQVEDANGQHTGTTSVIDTKPYPICVFTRSSGGFLAAVRIVEAATPEQAVAAVNQHVPVDASFPVTQPAGWTGGAMTTPNGLPGYPDAGSVYAVSKGTIAIIAISNQRQSIKGRQMVADVIANLTL